MASLVQYNVRLATSKTHPLNIIGSSTSPALLLPWASTLVYISPHPTFADSSLSCYSRDQPSSNIFRTQIGKHAPEKSSGPAGSSGKLGSYALSRTYMSIFSSFRSSLGLVSGKELLPLDLRDDYYVRWYYPYCFHFGLHRFVSGGWVRKRRIESVSLQVKRTESRMVAIVRVIFL